MLLKTIPLPYKILILVSVLTSVSYCSYQKGVTHERNAQEVRLLKLNERIAELTEEASNVKERVVTKFVDRVQTVEKKVYVYRDRAPKTIPDTVNVPIPVDTLSLLDQAVAEANRDPVSPGNSDERAAKAQVDLRRLIDNYLENVAITSAIREQLLALQASIKEQESIYKRD